MIGAQSFPRRRLLALLLVFWTGCATSSRNGPMRILDVESGREVCRIDAEGQVVIPGVGPAGRVHGLQVSLPAVPQFSARTETYEPSKRWLGNRYLSLFDDGLLVTDDGMIRLVPHEGRLTEDPTPSAATAPFARIEGLGRAPSPEQRARFLGMFDALALHFDRSRLPRYAVAKEQLGRCENERLSDCERGLWHSTPWSDERMPPGLASAFDRLLDALSARDADAVESLLCQSSRWTSGRRRRLFEPSGLASLKRGRGVEPGMTSKGDAIFLLPEAETHPSAPFIWRRLAAPGPTGAAWCLDR